MPSRAGIGLRAYKGGAVAVGVALEDGEPRLLLSCALETSAEGDRLSFEPYRVAAEMDRGPGGTVSTDAAAVAAEGRKRQMELAASGLTDIARQMAQAGRKPVVGALLVNRAGWITDLLEYSLAWPDHVPVAELMAVRDALRSGLTQCAIGLAEFDEKSLFDVATDSLDLSQEEIAAKLKALGATL
jgi:hypothetical protein